MTRPRLAMLFTLLTACTRPAAVPHVDLSAEAETIRRLTREWFEAEQRKDLEGTMKSVAPEMVVHPPGAPEIRGAAAIRQFYQQFYALPIESITGGSLETVVAASGDVAYELGWNRTQLAQPKGTPPDSGKYMFVWRKIDGVWKAVAGSYSSNGQPKP